MSSLTETFHDPHNEKDPSFGSSWSSSYSFSSSSSFSDKRVPSMQRHGGSRANCGVMRMRKPSSHCKIDKTTKQVHGREAAREARIMSYSPWTSQTRMLESGIPTTRTPGDTVLRTIHIEGKEHDDDEDGIEHVRHYLRAGEEEEEEEHDNDDEITAIAANVRSRLPSSLDTTLPPPALLLPLPNDVLDEITSLPLLLLQRRSYAAHLSPPRDSCSKVVGAPDSTEEACVIAASPSSSLRACSSSPMSPISPTSPISPGSPPSSPHSPPSSQSPSSPPSSPPPPSTSVSSPATIHDPRERERERERERPYVPGTTRVLLLSARRQRILPPVPLFHA